MRPPGEFEFSARATQDSWFTANELYVSGSANAYVYISSSGNYRWEGTADSDFKVWFEVTEPTFYRLTGDMPPGLPAESGWLVFSWWDDMFAGQNIPPVRTGMLYPGKQYWISIDAHAEGFSQSYELHGYFTPVPEPAALGTALFAAGGLLLKRRTRL